MLESTLPEEANRPEGEFTQVSNSALQSIEIVPQILQQMH